MHGLAVASDLWPSLLSKYVIGYYSARTCAAEREAEDNVERTGGDAPCKVAVGFGHGEGDKDGVEGDCHEVVEAGCSHHQGGDSCMHQYYLQKIRDQHVQRGIQRNINIDEMTQHVQNL